MIIWLIVSIVFAIIALVLSEMQAESIRKARGGKEF